MKYFTFLAFLCASFFPQFLNAQWTSSGGSTYTTDKVGVRNGGTVNADLHVGPNGASVLFDGSGALSPFPSGMGTRLFWNPENHALRAGSVTGTQWNSSNVGSYTFGFGRDLTIRGQHSFSAGDNNFISNSSNNSVAIGVENSINEYVSRSYAIGERVNIYPFEQGDNMYNVGLGFDIDIYSSHAFAIGNHIDLSGGYPTNTYAIGEYLKSTAYHTFIFGAGVNGSPLLNTTYNSMMFGVNSDIPTMYISGAAGVGTTGDVGIGTTDLQSKLHLQDGTFRVESQSSHGYQGDSDVDQFVLLDQTGMKFGYENYTYNPGTNYSFEVMADYGGSGGEYIPANFGLKLNNYNSVGYLSDAFIKFDADFDILFQAETFEFKGHLEVKSGSTTNFKVYQNGTVRAREIQVDLAAIPDYVFQESYNLMPLEELKNYVETNKHLPGIKSESEYEEEGSIDMGELQLKLLEKVEELTLYVLEVKEENDKLKVEIQELRESSKK